MANFMLIALMSYVLSVSAAPYQPSGYGQPPSSYGQPQTWGRPREYGSEAFAYITTSDLRYRLQQFEERPLSWHQTPSYGQTAWDFEIDDTAAGYKQTITGFGAAVTDATVINFAKLQPEVLNILLEQLMTPLGANFALMRHTIGASDLSPDPGYSYDDNGGQVDLELEGFNLGASGEAMAKLLAEMKVFNRDLTILGSPWSAPGWMKLNNQFTVTNATDNNLSDQYLSQDQPDYSHPFAEYFVKYIEAYEALGANIDAVTIQNEPLNSQAGYPTMYMFDYEQGHLINDHIGPAIAEAGLSTKVWAYDHNTDHPEFPTNVLSIASEYVRSVAWHCYATNNSWSVLTDFHNSNPGISQYMTECWTPAPGISSTSTNWFQAADFTIGPLQNWAEGVIAWTLATDENAGPHMSTGGCDACFGLVTVKSDGTYEFNMAFYLMAQFSKFMPKGARVLSTNGSGEGVQVIASENPDTTRTIVILNTKLEELMARVSMKGCGEKWSMRVLSNSIATWVLPAAPQRESS